MIRLGHFFRSKDQDVLILVVENRGLVAAAPAQTRRIIADGRRPRRPVRVGVDDVFDFIVGKGTLVVLGDPRAHLFGIEQKNNQDVAASGEDDRPKRKLGVGFPVARGNSIALHTFGDGLPQVRSQGNRPDTKQNNGRLEKAEHKKLSHKLAQPSRREPLPGLLKLKNAVTNSVQGLFLPSLHSWRNGRRARLRCVWRNPWEFESPRVHYLYYQGVSFKRLPKSYVKRRWNESRHGSSAFVAATNLLKSAIVA